MRRFKRKLKKMILFLFTISMLIVIALGFLATRYPIGYGSLIVKYSKEYNIDPYLVASIINVESKYDKYAISSKEARGLMQIGPQTGQWASEEIGIEGYNEDLLFDPDTNIKIGTWYIDRLFKEFDGKLDLVLAAYNAGSGNVSKWLLDEDICKDGVNLNKIPFKETEDYLVRVKDSYKVYSKVYKKHLLNSDDEDSFYINLLHNIRRTLKEVNKIL